MSVIQYHGNPNLKPFGVQIEYTPNQIQEYIKCKEDPLYFIEKYCKIISLDDGLVPFKLYEFQREFILAIHENRKTICRLSRQMGKCLTLNTKVRLRRKDDKQIIEITLGDFYEWQAFKEYGKIEDLFPVQQ